MAFKRFLGARGLFTLQSQGKYATSPHYTIPGHIPRPFYFKTKGKGEYPSTFNGEILKYSEKDIERMRKACRIAAQALDVGLAQAKQGSTTESIDKAVHEFIVSQNAYPSGVYYMGFPKSLCTSVNEVVCHGIPNSRPLESGDIINLDVTAYIDGFFGDNSDMALIGQEHPKAVLKLVEVTREAVWEAIRICKPGNNVRLIGKTIEEYVRGFGFGVCKEFIGHGIGSGMHMPPPIVHNENDVQAVMEPGMVFTIEPIVMENPKYDLAIWDDGWTIVDVTGGLSAQYEHTVLITTEGVEVLTDRTKF